MTAFLQIDTPAKAITSECRWCKGGARWVCESTVCALNGPGSSLKRIKAHCLDCAARDLGESAHDAVRSCDGHLLRENWNAERWTDPTGKERGLCFLLPYRFGKNPARPRRLSPEHKAKMIAALAEYHSRVNAKGRFAPVGSTITPGTGGSPPPDDPGAL